MKMQQSNELMSLCWCVAAACLLMGEGGERGRWWRPMLAGLAIGLGFNIKYVTAVALPYLLVRGAWRTVMWGVAWCGTLALAPALIIGWGRNADIWRGAVEGLLNAGGAAKLDAPGMARLMPMQSFGYSITTTMQRAGVALGSAKLGLVLAAAVAGAIVGVIWLLYRRAGVSLTGWRGLSAGAAGDERSRRLLAVEWAGLVIGMLAFSPQTNSRHIAMGLIATTIMLGAAVTLWRGVGGRDGRRIMPASAATLGILIAWLGLVLPLGVTSDPATVVAWHRLGGPAWCLVAGWLMVLWAVLEAEWVVPALTGEARELPGKPRMADFSGLRGTP
jgi:hypothetical protein